MWRTVRFKWGSPQTPCSGGTSGRKDRKEKILKFRTLRLGAAHTHARPWVKNPLVDWACSPLDRCVYCIMRCRK